MTTIWGPLGWMTLHSTACAYSEIPSPSERDLMFSWLDMFRDTITCPSCREHFTTSLANYRRQFPNMLQSRHEFVLFTFRVHNAVNRRLRKPIYTSVDECLSTLRTIVLSRSAREYRNAYWFHITRHWTIFQDISGIVALRKIRELKRIEAEYVGPRDTNFTLTIQPDIVVLPQQMLEKTGEPERQRSVFLGNTTGSSGFRITSNGLRLRR